MPTLVLMENAGRGAAAWLRDRGLAPTGRGLILCGPGNNGGDGGVVARHLDLWGYPVRVVWFTRADRLRGDAAVQFRVLDRSGFDQACWDDAASVTPERLDALLADADWLVDALLGTGLTRPVEGMLRALIEAINRSGKPAFALDLPSGLDADTGRPLGVAVHARATATFVAPKLGFAAPGADTYTGDVTVIDIGVPRSILEPFREGGARGGGPSPGPGRPA
jgi:NAD(P)H-hydrate epimerase